MRPGSWNELFTICYRQYTEFVSSKLRVPDSETAGAEVRGLPDVVCKYVLKLNLKDT